MKTSTALIIVAAAAAGLWLLGKQQEAALAAQLAAPAGSSLSRVVDDVVSGVIAQTGNPFGTTDRCPAAQKAAGTCDTWGAKRLGELVDAEARSECGQHGPYDGFECMGYNVERLEILKLYPGAQAQYDARRAVSQQRAQKAGSIFGGLLAKGSHT